MTELIERHSGPAAAQRTRHHSRDHVTAIYVVVSLLLLVPGLLAANHIGTSELTLPGRWLAALDRELNDIAFGHTLRFWLGVAGATMMGILLLYPLRKKFGIGHAISVAAWFHVHTILGLLGPVLILYHSYFGTGSTPANVALFTMLVVTAAGIFGHFAYTSISWHFHAGLRQAHIHLGEAKSQLSQLSASRARLNLIEELDTLDHRAGTERAGLAACFGVTTGLSASRSALTARALHLIESQGREDGWPPARCGEVRGRVQAALDAYFVDLSYAARKSAWERLARSWRLLHLPLFCITVIAASIHVYKVWNIDTGPRPALEVTAGGAIGPGAPDAIATRGAPANLGTPPTPPQRPAPFATRKVTTHVEPAASEPKPNVPDVAVRDPVPAPTVAADPAPPASLPRPEPPVGPEAKAPQAGTVAREEDRTARDPVAELAERSAKWDNTGRLDPTVVRERISILKKDPAFDHSKTRFPLTGKHARIDCENCHKTTLKDTARACIDCHKQDDVHRGRRPDCARCHVPEDWSTIIRR